MFLNGCTMNFALYTSLICYLFLPYRNYTSVTVYSWFKFNKNMEQSNCQTAAQRTGEFWDTCLLFWTSRCDRKGCMFSVASASLAKKRKDSAFLLKYLVCLNIQESQYQNLYHKWPIRGVQIFMTHYVKVHIFGYFS
jgi:hypothetical protein